MEHSVKSAVEKHVIKASGYNEDSLNYEVVKMLFRCEEVDFRFFNRELLKDVRMQLHFCGFTIDMKWDRFVLKDATVIAYYEKVMGLEYAPPDEKTRYQRVKGL